MPQSRKSTPPASPQPSAARSLAVKPYVALRRSARHQTQVRDLGQDGYASLVLGLPSGNAIVYELFLEAGAVRLSVKYPGKETCTVYIDPLPEQEVSRG
jgi:hypothetical protein